MYVKQMRKVANRVFCVSLAVVLVFSMIFANVYAADETKPPDSTKIDKMVQETLQKSKIPATSVATVRKENIQFSAFSATPNKSMAVDKSSLFLIGSMSKAFTGLAILSLESEGKLALTDPVSKHLPWLTFTYQGSAVKDESLTIANLLYQTSGLTNNENKYPNAKVGMTLEKSIRQLIGLDLTRAPGEKYAYANANFNILGLIIEVVSGQSYEKFMTEKIFAPLGLTSTYASVETAEKVHKITRGSKLSFLKAKPYDIPVAVGNVPAGYLISNAEDMGRWIQIQMGVVKVSPEFAGIIEKSHIPNDKSVVDSNTQYAAGWFIDKTNGLIYHSGGTENYSAKITMKPSSAIAACVLTNLNASANTNDIADNIVKILDGKPIKEWQPDIWLSFDRIFTVMTYASIILLIIVAVYYISIISQIRDGCRVKKNRDKTNQIVIACSAFMLIMAVTEIVILPTIFTSTWIDLAVWAPSSIYWGTISFAFLSILLIACSIFTGKYQKVKLVRHNYSEDS